MDKKEKISMRKPLLLLAFLTSVLVVSAQDVSKVEFCGNKYVYEQGRDSITLFLKLLDADGKKINLNQNDLIEHLRIFENGKEIIPERADFSFQRGIPKDYTFSVLVDLGISNEGKDLIYKAIRQLVESAPDSCVYISFFGDYISRSQLITKKNYHDFQEEFEKGTSHKFFYSALYSKLLEIAGNQSDELQFLADDYQPSAAIARRAHENKGKNFLFIFADGNEEPDADDNIRYITVTDYQKDTNHNAPKIYAFYYKTQGALNEYVELALGGVTGQNAREDFPNDRRGQFLRSDDMSTILSTLNTSIEDQMYDFAYIYKATEGKDYAGNVVYSAKWNDEAIGDTVTFSIGTPENSWPMREESLTKYLIALIATFLTIAFFFCVMKIVIPFIKSKSFSIKYYKKYQPEQTIQKRVCHYCKQAIIPGQMVVTKCKHVMHVHCWKQNDYRCAEYGQNCKTGAQDHVEWQNLFTLSSFRDCYQAISGVLAGLVSWIIYELLGRGMFSSLAKGITNMFLTEKAQQELFFDTCVTKVSAFMTIGLLLGFFLSLIFRNNDEYRKKSFGVYMKIIGLSLLTALIGMASFAFGGIIFCMLLSNIGGTSVPWYCSLPAYMLFSICTSLSLTIKSSIPVKSAMIGGLCSAFIGFLVLYFSDIIGMNMLLDFIIYGGGLGASLVTVRMLAEKYFLVIQNGIKAGLRIPIHKWMNATGGGNKVTIGMTGECEIQMNWEKSNKVAKEHAVLFIDQARSTPMIKPLAMGVLYNSRAELSVGRPSVLTNGDTFKIGDTIFQYVETD